MHLPTTAKNIGCTFERKMSFCIRAILIPCYIITKIQVYYRVSVQKSSITIMQGDLFQRVQDYYYIQYVLSGLQARDGNYERNTYHSKLRRKQLMKLLSDFLGSYQNYRYVHSRLHVELQVSSSFLLLQLYRSDRISSPFLNKDSDRIRNMERQCRFDASMNFDENENPVSTIVSTIMIFTLRKISMFVRFCQ